MESGERKVESGKYKLLRLALNPICSSSRVESGELTVEWNVDSGECKVETELFVS